MADAVFTTEATSSGDGPLATRDGIPDRRMEMPAALGGPGGATNPEHLFAAAFATCFHGALCLVAQGRGGSVPDGTTVSATVSLAPDDTSFSIGAAITANLPGLDQAGADELVAAANEVCPYSKATRGNVDVTLTAVV